MFASVGKLGNIFVGNIGSHDGTSLEELLAIARTKYLPVCICDKARNRNDGMAERNGKAERNGDKTRNGKAERNGDKTRNGMGIKRGMGIKLTTI